MTVEILAAAPWWVWVVHLLLYPVYQVLGTLKHEAAHALAAMAEGRGVDRFVVWPQRDLGYFTWGYVRYRYHFEPLPQYVHLMPYYVDVFWCTAGVIMLASTDWTELHVFWYVGAFIMALLLPAFDILYNVGKWMARGTGDFAQAFPETDR